MYRLASLYDNQPLLMLVYCTTDALVSLVGKASTGFIQATPGDIKSLRSSAERMALMTIDEQRHHL